MAPPLRQGPSAYSQGSRPLHPGDVGFCYLRVSTDEQAASGYGLDVQLEQCQRLWESDGLHMTPEHIFQDDYTGSTLLRPAYQTMRTMMQQVRPAALYIANPGRLSRKLADCEAALGDLIDWRTRLRIAENPGLDPVFNAQDRTLFQVLACFAESDKRGTVARLRNGLERSVREGNPLNHPALGYCYIKQGKGARWEVDGDPQEEGTAPWVVREAFQRFLAEPNLSALARWLDTTGIRPPRSHRRVRLDEPYHWPVPTVRGLLTNKAYRGTWYWLKTERSPNFRARPKHDRKYESRPDDEHIPVAVPPLVDTEVFDAVQALLKTIGRSGDSRQTHDYLFRQGRLRCGLCADQRAMCGITDIAKGKSGYECRETHDGQVQRLHRTQGTWKIDGLVWERIAAYLQQELPTDIRECCATWTTPKPTTRLPQLQKQRDAKQRQIDQWDDMCSADEEGEEGKYLPQWKQKRTIYEQELAAIEAQIAEVQATPVATAPVMSQLLATAQALLHDTAGTKARREVLEALDITGVWTPTELTLQGTFVVKDCAIPLDLPPIPLPTKGRRDYSVTGVRDAIHQRHPERLTQVDTFLADCCDRVPDKAVTVADLYGAYQAWCERAGEAPLAKIAFGGILTTVGIGRKSNQSGPDLRTGVVLRDTAAVQHAVPRPRVTSNGYQAVQQRKRTARLRAPLLAQVTTFLEACCVREADATVPTGDLYDAYCQWCHAQGEEPRPCIGFAKLLRDCEVGLRLGYIIGPRGKRTINLRTGVRLREAEGEEAHPGAILPAGEVRDSRDDHRGQLALFAAAD